MNFSFSEEQELLRHSVREFLEREAPMTAVREWIETPSGYAAEIWKQMAELGWIGLLIPEEYGGAGLGLVDLLVVQEELGRALLPSPFTANLLGTLAVLRTGSDVLRKEILPAVAAGDRILSFAITEEAGTELPEDIALRAERDGEAYRLSGVKFFVPHARHADQLVVAARTGGEGETGISLLLVDCNARGVEIVPLESVDLTARIDEVRFDAAPGILLVGEGSGFATWEWVRDRALVALAADASGGAEKVLEASVAHAKERIQFGKPIGVHQAIKHKCADMLIEVEAAKAITQYAAWALDNDTDDAPLRAAMAKARACDAYHHCSRENIQIHGGVGFTWEYDCHLYLKRAKAIEVIYGAPAEHRERVASMLGF